MASRIDLLIDFENLLPKIQLSKGDEISICNVPHLRFFHETFSETWDEYNAAIVNNILGLTRHVRSLMAWEQVLGKHADGDESLLRGITIDYVEPLLFRASDLPGAIRNQCHHMAGKLTYLYRTRDITLNEVRSSSHQDTHWRQYRDEHHVPCTEYERLVDKVSVLWASEGADHLIESHGRRHHNIATFVGMKRSVPMIEYMGGVVMHGYRQDEVDLHREIEIIDEQRVSALDAYQALTAYARYLSGLLEDELISAGVMTIEEA